MNTIPNAVELAIKKKPFLENALIEGIINLSALARIIKPEIEAILEKETNEGAIIMALNRLVPRLEVMAQIKFYKIVENIGDIIVRSSLCDYTFTNSKMLYKCHAALLERIEDMSDVFCTFSQGINETTLVVSSSIVSILEEIFVNEQLVSKTLELSSITVKLPYENNIYPGVYYYIFKELAWENINICEVISTTNEFTVVVDDKDIHQAFSILMESKKVVETKKVVKTKKSSKK